MVNLLLIFRQEKCFQLVINHFLVVVTGFQGKKDLVAVDTTDYEGGEGEVDDSENDENKGGSEHSSSDLDSDEERRR